MVVVVVLAVCLYVQKRPTVFDLTNDDVSEIGTDSVQKEKSKPTHK